MTYYLLNEKIGEIRILNLNYVSHYNFALCDCGSIMTVVLLFIKICI